MSKFVKCEVLTYVGEEMWEKVGEMEGTIKNDLIYWGLLVVAPWWPDMSDDQLDGMFVL